MIQETSLEAYLVNKDKFITQEQKVLEFIKNNPCCSDLDISIGLEININAVNGRRNKLFNQGLIIKGEKIKSVHTNIMVNSWIAK